MKYLLLSLLLLTACSITSPRPADPSNILVYKDSYVISAQGDWMVWQQGLRSSQIYPAGVFVIKESNGRLDVSGLTDSVSLQALSGDSIVPFDKEKEKAVCKEIQTEGVVCGANFVMRAY